MQRPWSVIHTAGDRNEAEQLRRLLAQRGIAARIVEPEESEAGTTGQDFRLARVYEVTVDPVDVPGALLIKEALDRYLGRRAPGHFNSISEAAPIEYDWPLCSQCSRRRETICPVCDTAGTDFPRAEYPPPEELPADGAEQESASPVRLLLVCPTCDEAFAPRFYRRCAWCGHDFGSGLKIEPPAIPERLVNPRVLVVLGGLVLIAAAVFAYWGFVLATGGR